MNWALLAAGVLLAAYQAWAITVRWREAATLGPSERRVLIGTLLATRGLGFLLGLLLIGGALVRAAG